MWAVLVVLAVVVILVVVFVAKGILIIHQAEAIVIERLGRYNRTLHAGINVILPIVEKKKAVTWTRTVEISKGQKVIIEHIDKPEGKASDETGAVIAAESPDRTPTAIERVVPVTEIKEIIEKNITRIDLREQVYDFPAQQVITKDNVVLTINGLLYYQITDPSRAVYEVADLTRAIEKLTQTTLRNVVGGLDLDATLSSRDAVNTKLKAILDEATDKWGVKVNRVEVQDIDPPDKIKDAMARQMEAERTRRAMVLTAQGSRESEITRAEGEKRAKILRAEGEAEARIKVARAEAEAITRITDSIAPSNGDPGNYLIALRYIETLKEMVSGKDNKVIYLPYEATGILSSIGGIKDMLEGARKGPA